MVCCKEAIVLATRAPMICRKNYILWTNLTTLTPLAKFFTTCPFLGPDSEDRFAF